MSNETGPPLWERQPYDTKTGYERFSLYYLPLPRPRTYLAAYRRYLLSERGIRREDLEDHSTIPSSWHRWVYAYTNDFTPYAGGHTWLERAQAWDDHKLAIQRQDEIERSLKIRREIQGTLQTAQKKIDQAVKNLILPPDITPDQLGRLMTRIYGPILDYYDLRPPERTAEDDRKLYDVPSLDEWQTKRREQLANLAPIDDNNDPERDPK